MWIDGTPYRNGVQMGEAALPIPLADQALREGTLMPPLDAAETPQAAEVT